MPATVSAVVVAFRSADHLPGILQDLDAQGVEEVVVVDNASPDDSAAVATAVLHRCLVVRRSENRGFAAGVNAGVSASSGDLLLLVNPDVRLAPGAVAALRDAHERRPDAILGPVTRDAGGRLLPTRRSLPTIWSLLGEEVLVPERARPGALPQSLWSRWGQYDQEVEAPLLSGVCLLVPREVWRATGPLDESYFLYWEEVDWELRARALGHPTVLVPAAEIVHARSASLGLHDPRRAALMGAATRTFVRRHVPRAHAAALVLLGLGQLARWGAWALMGMGGDARARARRQQHASWLSGACLATRDAVPRSSTWWIIEPFGRGGVAQYAVDVGRLVGRTSTVRLAVASGGPALGHVGPWERWFPRFGPAPLDRIVAAGVGLHRAWTRPARGDVAWVALGFRPTFERLLVRALRASGCRVLATVHNRRPHEGSATSGAVTELARSCDLVVVHTEELERWAQAQGLPLVRLPFPPPAGHVAVPSGTHTRATLSLTDEDVVLALIGNLRGYKGVDVLLEALGRLTTSSPVRVVLAGQAQGWDVAGAVRAAGADERVRLLEGYLPHRELLDVLDLADAAVLPYHRIDHSGAGALSASRGLPAIASDLPGLRELFGEAAIYVPAGDVAGLAAALERLPGQLDALRRAARPDQADLVESFGALVRALEDRG